MLLSFQIKYYLSNNTTISTSDYYLAITEANENNNADLGFGLDKAGANYGTRIFYADFEHGDGAEADLTSFRGKNVQLRFGFDSITSGNNNLEGWYVDDIAIWAATNPVTVEAFRSLNRYSDFYYEPSYIHWEADHDTFVFNEEQFGDFFSITTERQGSPARSFPAYQDPRPATILE